MLIDAFRETPSHTHGSAQNIVYLLLGAESHGLERVKPEPFTCECGITLTKDKMESRPNKMGATCSECGANLRPSAEERARAEGYAYVPSNERKRVTTKQREKALKAFDNSCVTGEGEASYVKRMVPPKYGGNRQVENLVALCNHHYEEFDHKFVDLLYPPEFYKVAGGIWRDCAMAFRSSLDSQEAPGLQDHLTQLLEQGQPDNPYPYIDEGWE